MREVFGFKTEIEKQHVWESLGIFIFSIKMIFDIDKYEEKDIDTTL